MTAHINAWREQEPRPYRAALLHLQVLAHAEDDGAWTPATKVSLRRALAHQGQTDGEATEAETTTALRHAIAQGLLRHDSTIDRLILTGALASA